MEIKIQIIIVALAAVLCAVLHTPAAMCIILGVALAAMLAVSIIFHRKREEKLGELISYLMRVQDDLTMPDMDDMHEGQLGILQNEIYKLVAQLKEQYAFENRQKTYMVDMLSDISHQIKTPITAISVMTELLAAPDLSEEKRLDYTAKIETQIRRITWLIKNLLTLSQLEADMLELKKESVDLSHMLGSIADTFEPIAEVKGVGLHLDVPDGAEIVCDRQWTTEAISNIVKNCIEHTPEGGSVSISASQNNIATEIVITDTGEGIAKEHLPNIFKRFYKAPGSSGSSVGIGLSMSKQIIMRQNGNISVKSEVGKGSQFCIKLYRSFSSQ